LKQLLPNDNEVADSLRRALLALEKSRRVVNGTKFGVEVEEITALDKLKAAIAYAGNLITFLFNHIY
jgi:DnaJ family protein C protein 7